MKNQERKNKKARIKIQECINTLEKIEDCNPELEKVKGVLRVALLEIDGLNSVWNEKMTDFEKAKAMKERGFKIVRTFSRDGVYIEFLGYYLWDLTREEIPELVGD